MESGRFAGLRALVTGGTSGIGLATVKRLVDEGAFVFFTGRIAEKGLAIHAEFAGCAEFVASDVTDAAAVESLFAHIRSSGPLHLAFNNAGVETFRTFLDTTLQDYDATMATNVRGVFLCLQHEIRLMLANDLNDGWRGSIVNCGSVTSMAAGFVAVYTTSKHAVLGLTKCTAKEFASQGININAVCPGPTDTPLARAVMDSVGPDTAAHLAAKIPAGRLGHGADTAATVAFLLSRDARYMHGASVVVDGGLLL